MIPLIGNIDNNNRKWAIDRQKPMYYIRYQKRLKNQYFF